MKKIIFTLIVILSLTLFLGLNLKQTKAEGGCTLNISLDKDTISNADLTTASSFENNISNINIEFNDADNNPISLRSLGDDDSVNFEIGDESIAVIKGNVRQFYVFGVSKGTTSITCVIVYNSNTYRSNTVNITVEGSILKDGGLEAVKGWHTYGDYWHIDVDGNANDDSWGFDVNSTFNMTGGNNMYIRMPNGENTSLNGSVRIYQDIYLDSEAYTFAVYIRRFPGIEQQPVVRVDGVDYDSFNTPVEVGAIRLDNDNKETSQSFYKVYEGDDKKGVGSFEACSVEFRVNEPGIYRLYLLAESESHVGMGMQVDNFVLTSGQQVSYITAKFGSSNEVKVDESISLEFHAYYSDGSEATITDVRPTYVSSNSEVLTITKDNKVYGLAVGEANIYVSITINGQDYNYTIEATVVADEDDNNTGGGDDTPQGGETKTTPNDGETTKKGCKSNISSAVLPLVIVLSSTAIIISFKKKKRL